MMPHGGTVIDKFEGRWGHINAQLQNSAASMRVKIYRW